MWTSNDEHKQTWRYYHHMHTIYCTPMERGQGTLNLQNTSQNITNAAGQWYSCKLKALIYNLAELEEGKYGHITFGSGTYTRINITTLWWSWTLPNHGSIGWISWILCPWKCRVTCGASLAVSLSSSGHKPAKTHTLTSKKQNYLGSIRLVPIICNLV